MSAGALPRRLTVPEIAKLASMTPRQVRRALKRAGVTNPQPHRPQVVSRVELRRALPELWETLQLLAQHQ